MAVEPAASFRHAARSIVLAAASLSPPVDGSPVSFASVSNARPFAADALKQIAPFATTDTDLQTWSTANAALRHVEDGVKSLDAAIKSEPTSRAFAGNVHAADDALSSAFTVLFRHAVDNDHTWSTDHAD